jgi:hypothetical protein
MQQVSVLVIAALVTGCGSGHDAVAPKPAPREAPVVMDASTVASTAPVRLELVEGTPATLPDGTTVQVRGVMYAHLSQSKNLSSCMLALARNGQTAEVSLRRLHGDPAVKATAATALGWSFTLEMADPYQQPSRAIVEASRAP